MSQLEVKHIKQAVVGGTTQPLKLGGVSTDGSDAVVVIDGSGNLNTTLDKLSDVVSTTPVAGQVLVYDGTNWVNGSSTVNSRLVSGTAVTASGTSVDFTGIPSWAKRITVMFNGVSTNGTSAVIIQLGSTTIQNSGYSSAGSLVQNQASTFVATFTTGFGIEGSTNTATTIRNGVIELFNHSSNIWAEKGMCSGGAYTMQSAGIVTLSGTLDRIRITTVNGTDTFDAGSINIMYEG